MTVGHGKSRFTRACRKQTRYNTGPVQEGLGGGRCAARCRHGQKGGVWRDAGCWCLLPRANHGGGVSLRDTEPLREGREGASRGIAEGTERRQQRGQEDVNPLVRFALAHAEQAPVYHLEGIGFEGDQDEEQSIFRRRERTVLIHCEPAGGPRFAIEAPRGEMRLERRLKRRDEELKLVERQAGEIEELCRARLHIGELDTGHTWCLLSWEAQYIIIEINSILDRNGERSAEQWFSQK